MCILRFFLLALGLAGVSSFAHADDWDTDYVEALFAGRQLAPIEGVWEFPADGASIVIVKDTPTTFNIFLLDSPSLDVAPGVLIGSAVSSPKKNYYDGELVSKNLGKKNKFGSQHVTFTVNQGGTLSIKPYKTGYSVSFKRWFSHFMKINIVENNKRPSDLDGAIRVYPYKISDNFPIVL